MFQSVKGIYLDNASSMPSSLLIIGQIIKGTSHRHTRPVQHMGIDHGGRDIGMAQQLLNGAYVISVFQ
jgi:hypothetical protein